MFKSKLGSMFTGLMVGAAVTFTWMGLSQSEAALAPCVTPTPTPAPSPTSTATTGPTAGKSIVFHDDFIGSSLNTNKWATTSYSYPNGGPTNPNDSKLDYLTSSAITESPDGNGVLTIKATKRSDGFWNTGLITGGNAKVNPSGGYKLKTGDFTLVHLRLPDTNTGAWPALWSWNNGGNEIDSFEWHTDNPNLLELTNHIRGGGNYYTNSSLVAPGKWVYIGTVLGASNNTWYVGSSLDNLQAVYSDHTGVGSGWGGAYPIINLSISSGRWHPAPNSSTPIVLQVGDYRVYH